MKPIEFKEVNIRFAENQPEYITLPAHKFDTPNGEVTLLTFSEPLTPTFF